MSTDLALPTRLDLPAATPLAEAILALRGQDLRLIGEEVSHLGTPGLQVLLSAVRTWSRDGKRLSLAAPSGAMTEQLALFGLGPDAIATPSGEG
ncbi:STAS domain-containing protein [Tropicimonas sp. IMCC6043]|uniref:STAS domain-containing protein n=1 Tax=Tropicimonas sp. IMCC6043 TaxID=2510645 RepID=UPI001A9311D2|nr:STAS domain-containing protein [Tropicimonas sp. IMCC6043]